MPSKKQAHQHTPYKFTPREIRILYVIDQKSFPHTYVEQSILQAHMSYEHSARPSTVLQMHMSYEELSKSKLDNPCWSIQTHLSYEHGTRPSAVLQIHMSYEELHGREFLVRQMSIRRCRALTSRMSLRSTRQCNVFSSQQLQSKAIDYSETAHKTFMNCTDVHAHTSLRFQFRKCDAVRPPWNSSSCVMWFTNRT